MKIAKLTIMILFALLLVFSGCSKEEEKVETEQTQTGVEQVDVPITQTTIDSFINVFPKVQEVVDEYRAELEKHSTDSPVDEAKTSEIMKQIEENMAENGVNQDWFFGVYQKVIMAGMYMNSLRQAESLKPENIQTKIDQLDGMLQSEELGDEQKTQIHEQIAQLRTTKQQIIDSKAQLEEMKAQLADPSTPDSLKPQLQVNIQQLERVFNPQTSLPEGITQPELDVINQNMERIIATLEKYNPQQPQAPQMPPPDASS